MKVLSFAAMVCLTILVSSCTYENGDVPRPEPTPDPTPDPTPMVDPPTIWTGAKFTFEKPDGGNPNAETNQDRITDKVWISRGNNGGQIFNVVSESNSDKASSPSGTQWALGTTDNIENLTFSNFRTALGKPKTAVGQDLVLLLVEENIAIDIKITKWSTNRRGGFAYERSTSQ
ncbi:MAG: hypothetical protein AAFY71_28695 [Bacteroidota bacterium]